MLVDYFRARENDHSLIAYNGRATCLVVGRLGATEHQLNWPGREGWLSKLKQFNGDTESISSQQTANQQHKICARSKHEKLAYDLINGHFGRKRSLKLNTIV